MTSAPSHPVAVLTPRRRPSWAWILPFAAILFAAWLGYQAWIKRGVTITVQLDDGHGLKAGDDVRYRGISVGKVDAVTVLPDLKGVLVIARLTSQSANLARSGSRFWVVRPQLELTRIQGLETLVGPRFLAVLPGSSQTSRTAPVWRDFVGLSEPPVVETILPGDLEIILQSPQRGSLRVGAPITYRQTRIGAILSVGLAGDSSAVEARAHIDQPYVPLIRPNTRFWDIGGLQAKLGLTGVSIEIESPEALLTGGVGIATPPPDEAGGDVVHTGHRFTLVDKPEKDWLAWQPMIAIGSSLLPPGIAPPSPLRATIGWKQGQIGHWIQTEKSHRGWLLQISDGVLGPADLLKPGAKAEPNSVVLEVAGTIVPLDQGLIWERNGLALLKANVSGAHWPANLVRRANEPEDCLAIADPASSFLPLASAKLKPTNDSWLIDQSIPIDSSWHGACVVSRADGKLIGMLIIEDEQARIALMPDEAVQQQ